MIALIDGDIIVYSVGFASDKRIYRIDYKEFKYKKEVVKYCERNSLNVDDVEQVWITEPLEYCLNSVKLLINKIIKETGATDYKIYLSGSNNFRNNLELTYPYKGNRDPNFKPSWYKEIKDYLVSHHRAQIVDRIEADDALAIEHCNAEYPTIICTLDKDLDQIPGLHYNWRHSVTTDISSEDAVRNYYTQVLTGDVTDNIIGPKGIGIKTATKLLEWCTTEEEMYKVCLDAYCLNEKRLMENMMLLWILRKNL